MVEFLLDGRDAEGGLAVGKRELLKELELGEEREARDLKSLIRRPPRERREVVCC